MAGVISDSQGLGGDSIVTPSGSKKLEISDANAISLLEGILTTLKKIEYHLYLGTDTELKDQDVGG